MNTIKNLNTQLFPFELPDLLPKKRSKLEDTFKNFQLEVPIWTYVKLTIY